jgi:hypothetical protein
MAEAQAAGVGLGFQQCVSRAVHSDTLEIRVDRGQQTDNFYTSTLTKHVEGPGAIFAAAPREKDLLFQVNELAECVRAVKRMARARVPAPHNDFEFTRARVPRRRWSATTSQLSACR